MRISLNHDLGVVNNAHELVLKVWELAQWAVCSAGLLSKAKNVLLLWVVLLQKRSLAGAADA
jgi:hypothetical protein